MPEDFGTPEWAAGIQPAVRTRLEELIDKVAELEARVDDLEP